MQTREATIRDATNRVDAALVALNNVREHFRELCDILAADGSDDRDEAHMLASLRTVVNAMTEIEYDHAEPLKAMALRIRGRLA